MSPWLSDPEVADLCSPLEQPAAQLRYLQRQGYIVSRKPNGRPLLMRAEVERVGLGGSPEKPAQNGTGPNRDRLLSMIQGGKRGAQTQGR